MQRSRTTARTAASYANSGWVNTLGLLFGLMLSCYARAQTVPNAAFPAGDLRETHNALFEAYFPIHRFDSDPKTEEVLLQERSTSWLLFSSNSRLRSSMQALNDLPSLGQFLDMESVTVFVKKTRKSHFQDLSGRDRETLLAQLHKSPSNDARFLAMLLRNSYLSAAYRSDQVKEAVTGVKMPVLLQPDVDIFLKKNSPVIPNSRLVYDTTKKELRPRAGRIDYLIVGSGPAGSVIASELRKTGATVVVLERGPFVVPGALETRSFAQLQESAGQRTSQDGGIYFRNGNTVGGGTTVNVDLAFAPTMGAIQRHIEQWRTDGRIRQDQFSLEEVSAAYGWVKGQVGTRSVGEAEVNPNNRALWDGASALGLHPKRYDLNTYAAGSSPYSVTDKRSALTQFLLPAMLEPANPLVLIPDTEVLRVLFEAGNGSLHAVGVEARSLTGWDQPGVIHDLNHLGIPSGDRFSVRAAHVILSAGALGSSTILLRSKLSNSVVGTGVVIHPSIPIIGLFKRQTHILDGTTAAVFVDDFLISKGLAFEAMSADPGYAALMIVGNSAESLKVTSSYSHLAGFGVMAIDPPEINNRVILNSSGDPEIEYQLSDETKARLRFGIAQAIRMMFKAGAVRVWIPSNEDIFDSERAQLHVVSFDKESQLGALKRLQFVPGRTILTSAHMQATNKRGSSPANSVVSQDFKVWGTENLYVMDSSIFPSSIGANPMQSIYTFAKIFADRLTESQRQN